MAIKIKPNNKIYLGFLRIFIKVRGFLMELFRKVEETGEANSFSSCECDGLLILFRT
jgi:hypothetical protein